MCYQMLNLHIEKIFFFSQQLPPQLPLELDPPLEPHLYLDKHSQHLAVAYLDRKQADLAQEPALSALGEGYLEALIHKQAHQVSKI